MADETRTPDPSESSDAASEDKPVDQTAENESADHEADAPVADVQHHEVEAQDESAEVAADESVTVDESALAGDAEQPAEAEAEAETTDDEELAEGEIEDDETEEDDALAEGEIDNDELDEEEEPEDNKNWYVVKVQSGREDTIKNAIERRVKIDGLEEFFGRILVPVEKVTEMRNNKRVVRKKKLYPGYLMVNVEYNDKILYLFRETSGVGDFVGGTLTTPPQPMPAAEIDYILAKMDEVQPSDKPAKVATSRFSKGDKVRVKDGTFVGMEGEVMDVLEAKGAVKVELSIFDRPVPVELEYWQVDFTE